MRYPITLTKDDNGTTLVSFPDFPEAHTFGDDRDEALTRAVDALATIIDAYIKDRRALPFPSTGRTYVELPALMTTKVQLYRSMQAGKIGKAELGRRLNWHLPQVDRLLDVRHGSQLDQLETAFKAMGKRLTIVVVDDTDISPRPPRVHAGVLTAVARHRSGHAVRRKTAAKKR